MYSNQTLRRLNDGKEAIDLKIPNGDLQALINYRHNIYSGIAALQSLDDLGIEENIKANADISTLLERFQTASDQITELVEKHFNNSF